MTKKAAIRISRLDSLGGVCSELARVYREARRGEMEMSEAKALTYVLREIRCALEASDIERRIEALEQVRT